MQRFPLPAKKRLGLPLPSSPLHMSSVWESIETLAGADVERPTIARMMVGNAGGQIGLS